MICTNKWISRAVFRNSLSLFHSLQNRECFLSRSFAFTPVLPCRKCASWWPGVWLRAFSSHLNSGESRDSQSCCAAGCMGCRSKELEFFSGGQSAVVASVGELENPVHGSVTDLESQLTYSTSCTFGARFSSALSVCIDFDGSQGWILSMGYSKLGLSEVCNLALKLCGDGVTHRPFRGSLCWGYWHSISVQRDHMQWSCRWRSGMDSCCRQCCFEQDT